MRGLFQGLFGGLGLALGLFRLGLRGFGLSWMGGDDGGRCDETGQSSGARIGAHGRTGL